MADRNVAIWPLTVAQSVPSRSNQVFGCPLMASPGGSIEKVQSRPRLMESSEAKSIAQPSTVTSAGKVRAASTSISGLPGKPMKLRRRIDCTSVSGPPTVDTPPRVSVHSSIPVRSTVSRCSSGWSIRFPSAVLSRVSSSTCPAEQTTGLAPPSSTSPSQSSSRVLQTSVAPGWTLASASSQSSQATKPSPSSSARPAGTRGKTKPVPSP